MAGLEVDQHAGGDQVGVGVEVGAAVERHPGGHRAGRCRDRVGSAESSEQLLEPGKNAGEFVEFAVQSAQAVQQCPDEGWIRLAHLATRVAT